MLLDAETAGKAALEAASARAEVELKELRQKADVQTAAKTAAMEEKIAEEADKLRKAAEEKLDAAAALIVERIVNS